MKIVKKLFIILFLILSLSTVYAQKRFSLEGTVSSFKNETKKEPIPFATVYLLESGAYTDCDENGKFLFKSVKGKKATLIATAIGFNKDTIIVEPNTKNIEFVLKGENEIEKAVVTATQAGSYLSKMTPMKTEVITAAGLCKMACCNLAESFENSASVSVGYSDAVTGSKQIRLLGLSGIYTQMLDENRPVMRGLAAPFGLSYIPGQWLESIQIAKGPSSVINGLEAITGQINMEHRKPTAEQPLFLNLFLSHNLRAEANAASSLQLNEKWSTVVLGHFSTDAMAHDGNGDGFRDEPNTMQFNLANRWLYFDPSGVQIRFGVTALSDERIGGQMGYTKQNNGLLSDGSELWGSIIRNRGINGYLKAGFPLNKENTQNIAFVADYTYYDVKSNFGKKLYSGEQNLGFINLIYQNTQYEGHRFSIGLRNQYDNINERLFQPNKSNGINNEFLKRENQLGIYGEYTFELGEKFTLVTDLSLDYNNRYGLLFAPRMNLKYAFTDFLVFRAAGGRGFRSPNVIVDNIGILSTGREIVFNDKPQIEDAWTYGGNFTAYIPIGHEDNSYLSFDFFRTDFNKQIIVDQEKDWSKVLIYNLEGRSYTNTYQVDFSVDPFKGFNILATFRYTDAKVTLHSQGLVEKPLTSRYKGVLNLQYSTNMNIWTFDFTAQINGPSRLPNFVESKTGISPAYPILFAQVTRKFKGVDVYIGGENLTNYKQKNPIIEAENPFSDKFNASTVWGPIMGIKIYAGMRFTLWKK